MSEFNLALQVAAFGMGGVFGFMALFYVTVRLIDKAFPPDGSHEQK